MLATANALFGPDPTVQAPTPSAQPEHLAGTPEPMAKTTSHVLAPKEQPILALVALIGAAVVILQLAARV